MTESYPNGLLNNYALENNCRQNSFESSSVSRWSNCVNFKSNSVDNMARSLASNELCLSTMNGTKSKIQVQLANDKLWQLFRDKETEMIITRAGRRMFPVLDFTITGLDPDDHYSCMIQIIKYDNYRYRFDVSTEKWSVAGEASHPSPENENFKYMHPHGSAQGKVWMKEGARFDKVKLSNHHRQFSDFIILTSLQKYKAQLVITRFGAPQCDRWIFDFPQTAFIAVTCYQNPNITRLKIHYNPFAKAFREGKRPAKQPTPSKSKTSRTTTQRSTKRPRLALSSPPPVTRLHPPPLGHFPDDEQRRIPSPPPPPPPLNLYCQSLPQREILSTQEDGAMQSSRYVPLTNDPLLWEPTPSMTTQRTCLPSFTTSFRLDQPYLPQQAYFKPEPPQTFYPGWHHDCHKTDMTCCSNHGNGNYGNAWLPGTSGYGGLFEDIPLRHHAYDNMYWREI